MRLALGALLIPALLALAACAGGELDAGPVSPRETRALASLRLDPAATVAAVNAYRASRGLGAVRLDSGLTAMAQHQADAMAANGALSHTIAGGFDARLTQAGIDAGEAGENLGAGYYSLEDAMAGWRGSPEHDANLLRPGFTRIGVAIAKNGHSHWGAFWAMELAGEAKKRVEAGN